MLATIEHSGKKFRIDFSKPLDISIPLKEGNKTVNAYFAPRLKIEPVKMGDWIGEVKQGALVNYRNIFFNPHGNGTHTECVGHISKENISINQCLKEFFFVADLISIKPEKIGDDFIIVKSQISNLKSQISNKDAVILRTLPNEESKLTRNYSGKNPPYIESKAIFYLVSLGINHILIDLPSLDRGEDGGKLLAHKAFWNFPKNPKKHRTITELIYVSDEIKDGTYLLNLQIAGFENDATPSKPVLYKLFSEK